MDWLLILVLGVIVGCIVGHVYTVWVLRDVIKFYALKNNIDIDGLEKPENQESKTETKIQKLKIETHGEQLYCYDYNNDTFVCQGNSLDELAKLANDRKQIHTAVVVYNEKIYAFVNGTVRGAT